MRETIVELVVQGVAVQREVLIAHSAPVKPAAQVRSTLLQSSLATLKACGHYENYLKVVSPVHRDAILGAIAPTWLPIDVALAHYQACDDLQLNEAQMVEIGEATGDRVQGSFMETLTRAARGMGVTPLLLLKRFDVLWDRLLQGGSIELVKVGPKDLTIEVLNASLPRYAYFRTGFCGVVKAGFKYVGTRCAYVRISQWDPRKDRFVMRAQWV